MKKCKLIKKISQGMVVIAISAISTTQYGWAGNTEVNIERLDNRTYKISAEDLSAKNLDEALKQIGAQNYVIKAVGADSFVVVGVTKEIMNRVKVSSFIFK